MEKGCGDQIPLLVVSVDQTVRYVDQSGETAEESHQLSC